MTQDAPDWQRVVTVVTAVSGDAPDWERVVVGPGGVPIGSGYASLTGAGETVTPGDLDQEGGFVVNVPVASSTGLQLSNESPIEVVVNDNSGYGIVIDEGGGGIDGGIQLIDHGGGGITLTDNGAGGLVFQSNFMSFFTNPVVAQPTVTGSRGGNAALASLLTALNALGLIIDSSTP